MYIGIKKPYALRGWKHNTAMLVDQNIGRLIELDNSIFRLLLLCDGTTDFDQLHLQQNEKNKLSEYAEKGYIEYLEHAAPIDEIQRYFRYDNRLLESIEWSVTGKCNFRCKHCFMDSPDALYGDLTTEQALSVIDQMANCGVVSVDLTGGEPFVRNDFWQLVDRLKDKHIILKRIYTNGWLLKDDVLDAFEQRGMKPLINISFDGPGWHDWMRGVKGAEEAALKAIRTCVSRGFIVGVQVCLFKGNKHLLRDTVNLLASAGVSSIKVGSVTSTALWTKNAAGNDMDIREYYDAALEYIPYFYRDGMPANVMLGSIIKLNKGSTEYSNLSSFCAGTDKADRRYVCPEIRTCGYLSPDGRLLPCMAMLDSNKLDHLPNILETGLKAALNDGVYMDYINSRISDLMKHNEECRECPYIRRCCAGCRAAALLGPNQDLWAPDREYCILWKEGYAVRITQIADQAIRDHVK